MKEETKTDVRTQCSKCECKIIPGDEYVVKGKIVCVMCWAFPKGVTIIS